MSDFSEQEVGTSTFVLKRDFSEEKSKLGRKTELQLKVLITAQLSEVFIFNLILFLRRLLLKNAFIEDWPQGFFRF